MRALNDRKIAIGDLRVSPQHLAELIALIDKGDISTNIARTVFDDMVETGDSPVVDCRAKGACADQRYRRTSMACSTKSSPTTPPKSHASKMATNGSWASSLGQLMKATRGQANPQKASQLLIKKIGELIGQPPLPSCPKAKSNHL